MTQPFVCPQAAAIVLGMPSALHSHSFVYVCVWDAVRLVDILEGGGMLILKHVEEVNDVRR